MLSAIQSPAIACRLPVKLYRQVLFNELVSLHILAYMCVGGILHWYFEHMQSGAAITRLSIINYLLFAYADTGIYPHTASQYHARPKAKRGIAMLSVNKFPYPRMQTRCIEFIPCSNIVCQILKRLRSFDISDIPFIWSKSSYKDSVARSQRCGKERGR